MTREKFHTIQAQKIYEFRHNIYRYMFVEIHDLSNILKENPYYLKEINTNGDDRYWSSTTGYSYQNRDEAMEWTIKNGYRFIREYDPYDSILQAGGDFSIWEN